MTTTNHPTPNPYSPVTSADRDAMLERIGIRDVASLFDSIPEAIQLHNVLPLGEGLSEMELDAVLRKKLATDCPASGGDAVSFLGCGSYDHFIPATVDALASDPRFVTAYTPYQAEASQGSLQVFFEYQTLVTQLTGMDVANASHYDGATACVEAALMATAATRRHRILVPASLHPEYYDVLRTVLAHQPVELVELPTPNGTLDPETLAANLDSNTAGLIVQHPNFFGCLEDVTTLSAQVHSAGGLLIVCVDPVSLGILARPDQYGADIVVAEGQPLGIPMSFGGPYLGLMACRESLMRRMPGRLVGETTDRRGRRCWVLTMQTREQHIRREKATSNICSNQGLMAIRAAIYLALVGPQGLRDVANYCLQKSHYLAQRLTSTQLKLAFDKPFFKEFVVRFPNAAALEQFCKDATAESVFAGVPLARFGLDDCLLAIAVTEKRTAAELDQLVALVR